jgi:hypothetical protein
MRPNLVLLAALLLGLGALAGRVSAGDAAPPGQPPGLSLCTSLCRRSSAYEGAFVEHGACYRDGHAERTVEAEAASPNETHAQLLRGCPKP